MELVDAKQAAQIMGFKNAEQFNSWQTKNNAIRPVKQIKSGRGKPVNMYDRTVIEYHRDLRDPAKKLTKDDIDDLEAVKILGYTNPGSLREIASKNPGKIKIKKILYKGKIKNFYSRKNIIEIRGLLDSKSISLKWQKDRLDDKFNPTKPHYGGFNIKNTQALSDQIMRLTAVFITAINKVRGHENQFI